MPEAIGIIAGIAVMALLFKPIFDDATDFWDCVRLWFTPDIISLFRGEWGDDWWAEMKLGFWFLCGFLAYFAVSSGVAKLFV